jgi:hypothetical protein
MRTVLPGATKTTQSSLAIGPTHLNSESRSGVRTVE